MTNSGSEQWNLVEREWKTKNNLLRFLCLCYTDMECPKRCCKKKFGVLRNFRHTLRRSGWGPGKLISEGRCTGEIIILILQLLYWASHRSAVCGSWLLWPQSTYRSRLKKGWFTRIYIYLISNNLVGEILLCISSSYLALTSQDDILSPFSIRMVI